MSSVDTFRQLMEQVRSGSDEAARSLLERYGDHIRRAVRRRLHRLMRSKFDSQDFVQSVWGSFFADRQQATQFETPEQLAAYLARIASNKVVDECRHHMQTLKSNVRRERKLTDRHRATGGLAAVQPTASELAIADEQLTRLTDGQPSRYRRMVELRAGGATHEQIADRLGVSKKTVQRVFKKLSTRLEG